MNPIHYCFQKISNGKYGKCPKISNTLKFRTPNIFAQNNFWKCPKISNSSSFAKRGFLKFRTQLSTIFYRHNPISVTFFFFFHTEPGTIVVVLKATTKRKCTQQCHNEFYVHKRNGNRILILYKPRRYLNFTRKKKKKKISQEKKKKKKKREKERKTSITMFAISTRQSRGCPRDMG